MVKSMKVSIILLVVGLILIVVGFLLLFLTIVQWEIWIENLELIGILIILLFSIILIIIGIGIIIKFIT